MNIDKVSDEQLVEHALAGDKTQLKELVERIQTPIYNLAMRMLSHPQDAQDATQEILIKVVTNLSSFEGNSRFQTWVWRIAVNHLLNTRKQRSRYQPLSFEDLAQDLDRTLPSDSESVEYQTETSLLVEEAKIGCMQAMLRCLNEQARATYILGEIMGITDQEGALVFEVTPSAFRKRLSRARQAIRNFMQNKCGLVNPANPCRCQSRVRYVVANGYIDPDNIIYAQVPPDETLQQKIDQMDELERAAALFRAHPTYKSPDFYRNLLLQWSG